MKRLLVLGAGTAGTMVVNKLRPRLSRDEWAITIVDQDSTHHYQPGYLFIPFGTYEPDEVLRPRERFLPDGVELVIASGSAPHPDETEGMAGDLWYEDVFDFYTHAGATALGEKLATWEGGRLVVHITEMPIKCPVAPLEFSFLADDFFTRKGIREDVRITYVTPLDGAFTKPVAAQHLGGMLADRGIQVETDFMVMEVDNDDKVLRSYDDREIPFDLLVTVPVNMGADFVGRSGLGDELNFVPVDNGTLQSTQHDNIFALGDASNIPASKAGSVAHFEVDVFTENFLDHVAGRPMTRAFDGHANCFIESGNGKGLLIDFNYDTEPLPGKYPLPGIGPFSLLKETEANHWGKLLFKWTYWNVLLPGREMPLPALMSMLGKQQEVAR